MGTDVLLKAAIFPDVVRVNGVVRVIQRDVHLRSSSAIFIYASPGVGSRRAQRLTHILAFLLEGGVLLGVESLPMGPDPLGQDALRPHPVCLSRSLRSYGGLQLGCPGFLGRVQVRPEI